ncbi:MAG: helix-turn-helix transcriptional regulator [Saprospiraceae bacterium]
MCWSAFKDYFGKAHRGFLHLLRSQYPDLTDAEERLFLFIKLNLSTKEIAVILGIAVSSVKKTRYRLRKRLGLEEGVDLQEFILSF